MDTWLPVGTGMFQLHRDGAPAAVASYVDRTLSRSEQIDQLGNAASWLPEQVIAAAYEQIMENGYQALAEIPPLTGGRLLAPQPVKLAVLLAPGEAVTGHPLRPYLWPLLDGEGELILEQGEQLIDRERISAPQTMSYADTVFANFTTHRIATTAKLSLPTDDRSDYKLSLGLVSPTLMEGFAVLRQLSRIGQNQNRRWAQHYRYEWLTNITKLTTTKAKKKLFGGRGAEHVSTRYQGEMRWPDGRLGHVDLWRFHDERLESLRDPAELARRTLEFEQKLEQVCRARGLGWTATESNVRDIVGGTEAKDVFTLDRNAAYSLPCAALSA